MDAFAEDELCDNTRNELSRHVYKQTQENGNPHVNYELTVKPKAPKQRALSDVSDSKQPTQIGMVELESKIKTKPAAAMCLTAACCALHVECCRAQSK